MANLGKMQSVRIWAKWVETGMSALERRVVYFARSFRHA